MSQLSKLRQSRAQWKHKATERADHNRSLRKQLARVARQRDRQRKELKEARARLHRQEGRGLVVQPKADLVLLALKLFSVARIGFRAVSRVLALLGDTLGLKQAPCPQTIVNWVTRLSMVRIQSAWNPAPPTRAATTSSNGSIWMIDVSIGLGTGKILAVLALDMGHHQLSPGAPSLQQVHCIAVSVAASWTGESIADFLQRLMAVAGRPAAYLKDGGGDLRKAVRLVGERGLPSSSIDDLSHVVAILLKRRYEHHPRWARFVSACGRLSGKLKQTVLACLAPPKVQTKARFMNVHRLVTWADRLLEHSPVGRAATGSTLSKLRACLDSLPSCKALIKQFLNDATPLLECQKILKTRGLSHQTLKQCQPLVDAIPSPAVRHGLASYLQAQLDTATTLGLAQVGLPISSDPIESLFGLAKQHGVGQIKDAHRIALRLPALCGTPTTAEAQQVLRISVAQQQELTHRLSSLTKQRREVLPNPGTLEQLARTPANDTLEFIPRPENRSNHRETIGESNGCKEKHGPGIERRDARARPASAVP